MLWHGLVVGLVVVVFLWFVAWLCNCALCWPRVRASPLLRYVMNCLGHDCWPMVVGGCRRYSPPPALFNKANRFTAVRCGCFVAFCVTRHSVYVLLCCGCLT